MNVNAIKNEIAIEMKHRNCKMHEKYKQYKRHTETFYHINIMKELFFFKMKAQG